MGARDSSSPKPKLLIVSEDEYQRVYLQSRKGYMHDMIHSLGECMVPAGLEKDSKTEAGFGKVSTKAVPQNVISGELGCVCCVCV